MPITQAMMLLGYTRHVAKQFRHDICQMHNRVLPIALLSFNALSWELEGAKGLNG